MPLAVGKARDTSRAAALKAICAEPLKYKASRFRERFLRALGGVIETVIWCRPQRPGQSKAHGRIQGRDSHADIKAADVEADPRAIGRGIVCDPCGLQRREAGSACRRGREGL